MAAHHKTIEHWSAAPDPDIRRTKTRMEDELLIKLGAKKEAIEFHPLILSSRLERATSAVNLRYSRVNPPAKEKRSISRNPWCVQDPALRQISNPARRGPRDYILPSLVKTPAQIKVYDVPLTDEEYHARRAAAFERLTQLFSEWTVYNRRAFPLPISRQAHRSDIDPGRKISKATVVHIAQGQPRRGSNSSTASSASSKKKPTRPVPRSRKKKNRWKEMASEVLLHIQSTHMRLPEELPRSELRVYVSSTPDLQEEREFLEEVAYPKLRELCEKLGLNCHVVDMRNGAGILTNDIETFDLIEKELRNCRTLSIGPFFVSLIGHTLDDQYLPGFLPKVVYEEIRETLIKEDIIGVEAFDDVYRLDSNRVPPVYIKQPVRAVEEYQSPEEVEKILHRALSEAVSLIWRSRQSDEYTEMDFYKWSAVVKEVEEGLLNSFSPRSDTLCFMMDVDLAQDPVEKDDQPIRRLRHNVYHHYRHFASKENLLSFKAGKKKNVAYLRSIADTFVARVVSLLRSQIRHREYDITQQLTEGSEALQHVRIALREAENKTGNDDVLTDIRKAIERSDSSPKTVLLWGPSGAGKTAIACQAAKASVLWQPRRRVVFRCLGTTLRSSSLFRVLESLIKQLNFIYSLDIDIPFDMSLQRAVSVFCYTLNAVSAKRELHGDLLLVLDQLERLPDLDAHYLLCILNSLSEGTTLILSLQTPHPLTNVLESHGTVQKITRGCMSKKEIRAHITQNLELAKRVVTTDQLQLAMNALPANPTPLYAQMALHTVRWWPSHTLPETYRFSNLPEIDFGIFLETIESDLGKAFTRYALSFLASARHGLADQEILHLVAKDSDLLDEIKEEQDEFVSVVEGFSYQRQLSRLISRLGKFVVNVKLEGETVYQISSQPLIDAITSRYMSDEFFSIVHHRLANFFLFIRRGLLLSSRDISEQKHKQFSKYHWRTLRCVPYHLCHSSADTAEVWERLKEKVFFNFAWLVNEVYSGFFSDLLEDLSYALDNVSLDPDILYFQQLLLSVRHTVTHNPISLAAVFASQNVNNLHNVKDAVRTVVQDARVWLKQVHLQALVPVSYTTDKIARLMVKENSIFEVTNLRPIPGTGRLLVQRNRSLFILNMLTCEEIPLATVNADILDICISDMDNIVVLTLESGSKPRAEIFNLQKGKHVRTVGLGDVSYSWFDCRSMKASYFAVDTAIKCVDLEEGAVKNVFTTKKPWTISCVSACKPEKVITVLITEKTKIEAFPVKDIAESRSVYLKNEPTNKHCKPLLSTKDGKYVIYVRERQATVIECSSFKVVDTYSYNGLPIVIAELSRSHEHLFLGYANGSITCHVMHTGNQAVVTQIKPNPRPQWMTAAKTRDKSRSKSNGSVRKNGTPELFTTFVTSEDDHFLLCGTNLGHVYIIHVPSGHQLVDITTQQQTVEKMVYLTDKGHFQHFITLDSTGMARHWNLRPLFKQTRLILQLYIIDDDLQKEEEAKLELKNYFPIYEARKNNRIFLNGPDIAAFYQQPPANIFAELADLDPAFGVQNDWEVTGMIADLNDHLIAMICGSELSDVILTVSNDFRLSRWSLHDGSLVWSRRLPCQGEGIHDIASVYYDQAVLLVEQSRVGRGYGISVIYTGEGHNKLLSRDNVTCYWASLDRTRVMLMCQPSDQQPDAKLYLWDLINAKEETCELVHSPPTDGLEPGSFTFTTFSPSLQNNIFLILPKLEETTTQSAGSHRFSCSRRRPMSQHSAPDPDIDSSPEEPASPVGGKCGSPDVRPSISDRKMYESDSRPMSYRTPSQTPPTTPEPFIHGNNTHSLERSDMMEADGITEMSPEGQLSNATTSIHWTKIRTGTMSSKAAGGSSHKTQVDGTTSDKVSTHSVKTKSVNSARSSPVKFRFGERESNNSKGGRRQDKKDTIPEEADGEAEDSNEHESITYSHCRFQLQVTAVCFVGEDDILVGTSSQHLLLIGLPSFQPVCALGENGPNQTNGLDGLSDMFLREVSTPHRGAITFVTTSDDTKLLISSDSSIVCLWDVVTRNLIMTIKLDKDQEISHMVISKDAAIIAIATNDRAIRLWTPVEHREVANYMTTFDIVDLQMTCDCRKVIVRGVGPENKPILEIFDVRNIDDILVHVANRKQSQQQERMDNLNSERVRRASRQHYDERRKSLIG